MEQPSNYSLSKDEYFLLSCRKFYGSQVLYVNKWVGRRNVRARTRIWLDRIACGGREYNLGYCLRKINRWGQVRCNRQRLAGVMCDPGLENLIKTPPLDNATKHIDVSDSRQVYVKHFHREIKLLMFPQIFSSFSAESIIY
jgi:hypothetical protein